MDIPKCDLPFGAKVVVTPNSEHHDDFPDVLVISGIEWRSDGGQVGNDEVNITLLPTSDLQQGGYDGFTTSDLRLATDAEIKADRRGAA